MAAPSRVRSLSAYDRHRQNMTSALYIAASLSPDTRQDIGIQVLSRSQPISHIAATHQVSRKFVYQKGDGIEDSSDDDIDGDGIANAEEVSLGIFPYKADSDGDGVDDPTELNAGTDPVDPRSL